MEEFFKKIKTLLAQGEVRVSGHGHDELAEDELFVDDLIGGILGEDALPIEFYPDFPKGPCVLCLTWESAKRPVHSLWGIPKGKDTPCVLVTAYRPDPARWLDDFIRRRK